jgi:uncharacterized lipoprotein YajG
MNHTFALLIFAGLLFMAACNQTAPADQGEQPQQEIASADEAVRNNSEESLVSAWT